ncbi:BatD family protein [Pseudoroseomonas ludipueritiae]|uniref:BatD family protein n=1 Tax=Pseudoroseomonas ludipueritiae TaxID=198093 RepID=A0ABR7R1Q6_9PROT|nr:BatD family protein [Pseudoroseomonas ludipueritiae]MBC9175676.1 BatD family protein [Pseudoroseomonas ludipueritiae]
MRALPPAFSRLVAPLPGPLLLAAAMLLPAPLRAQPALELRVVPDQPGPLWFGQHVGLTAILRTRVRFGGSPSFPDPAMTGHAVVLPNGSTTPGTEREGGVSYVLLQHRYDLFPLQTGSLVFPALKLVAPVIGDDGGSITAQAESQPLTFEVRLPPGVRDLHRLVTSPEASLTSEVQGDPARVPVGEALTRRITLRVSDTTSMVLPAVDWQAPSGMRAYPDPPRLEDSSERGVLRAQRIDSAAFVPQRPGRFVLPGSQLQWFNPDSGALTELAIAPLVIEAVAVPVAPHSRPWWRTAPAMLVLLALILGLLGWWAVRHGKLPRRLMPAETPEAAAFAALRRACHANAARPAMAALLRWAALILPPPHLPTLPELARLSRSPALAAEAARLSDLCFAAPAQAPGRAWNGAGLAAAAVKARRRLRRRSPGRREAALPSLNPAGSPTPPPRLILPGWHR